MDNAYAIEVLSMLRDQERRLIDTAGRFAPSREEQRRIRQRHAENYDALGVALDRLTPMHLNDTECPEPVQEQDEYRCVKCGIRWDVREDKPTCAKKDR